MFDGKTRWSNFAYSLFFVLFAVGVATAQSVTGTISGTVLDASGRVIAGARITLINEQTAGVRTATTNGEGDFTVTSLQPGVYTIKIDHNGFRSYQRTNNALSANEHLTI